MKTIKYCFIFLLTCQSASLAYAQVLHTENFNVILDSSKTIKGSFMPNFRYRNLKEDYTEIGNTADISIRFKKNAITIANRLEYARFGKENLLSGGFIYLEYMHIEEKKYAIEPFFQMHWQEIRGLDRKYAVGSNFRWAILVKQGLGLYAGIGSFYEFEKWVYTGVSDETRIPENPTSEEVNRLRGASYISFKKEFQDLFILDVSAYYQPTLKKPGKSYRLAGSFELTYQFSKYLGLTLLYQNIYDTDPVVPIDKLFNDVNFGLTFSF